MRGESVRRFAWLLAVVVVLLLGVPALGAETPEITADTLTDVEDFLAAQLTAEGRPGLSAAVVVGEEVHTIELGEADKGQPVTENTVFQVASLSKSLTALAVAQLAEQGRLDLSDPVTRYIPELKPGANDVTVADVMHQFSGVSRYSGNEPWVGPLGESLEANVVRLEPEFSPGSSWEYSNANYDTLALVVERVSGESFPDYMAENVFAQLGMEHTYVGPDAAEGLAQGYYYRLAAGYGPVDLDDRPGMAGSAGVLSTTTDLARFIMVQLHAGRLEGEQVVPVAAVEMVQQPRPYGTVFDEPPPVEPGYAGGLYVEASFPPDVDPELAALTTLWHRGDGVGFQSALWMIPEADVGFVVLTNGHDYQNDDWTAQLSQGVKHILFGLDPPDFYQSQDPLRRLGKQLLLIVAVAQIILAIAVIPALRRRHSGAKLHISDWVTLILASIVDLAALLAIVWIIPKTGDSPLRVVIRAPDYRVIVLVMGAGVVWGVIRSLMLMFGEPRPRATEVVEPSGEAGPSEEAGAEDAEVARVTPSADEEE